MLPRLSRKMKWGVFGTVTTATCLYYIQHTKNNKHALQNPATTTATGTRATTTLLGKHVTHEDVVDGRQVLSNLGNFQWHDINPTIRQRYTAPYTESESDSPLWRAGNTLVIGSIGLISKFVLSCLENTKALHMDQFLSILHDDQRQRGIITVSNHMSVWDDPVLWGIFPMKTLLDIDKMRWVLGAADICYTSIFKATFFSMGKAIPTIRGGGIYQPAVDFAIDRLNHRGWIHVFPEGKVNQTEVMLRFKWGIGRLIMESDVCPIIIPMWHQGMDLVRPLRGPFVQIRKPVLVVFGEPLDCQPLLDAWKKGELTEEETRIQLTSKMVDAINQLKEKTSKNLVLDHSSL